MEAMWTKCLPVTARVKEWVAPSRIGNINYMRCDFGDRAEFNPENRVWNKKLGGNALIIGAYGRTEVKNFWKAQRAVLYNKKGEEEESFGEPFKVNGYEYELEKASRCIQNGELESRAVPLRDTLDVMEIMDELRRQWGLIY